MGFASRGVWVMGYCGCMGYEALFPANQLGGLKNVWNLREYGVCEPWVTRESTVRMSLGVGLEHLQILKEIGTLFHASHIFKYPNICTLIHIGYRRPIVNTS